MKLNQILQTGFALSGFALTSARLLTVPTTPFEKSSGQYSLSQIKRIIVDSKYADAVDKDGQTFIPPTLQQFAETFQGDLKSSIGLDVSISQAKGPTPDSIFITVQKDSAFKDIAGRPTSEGYKLDISDTGIVISGASPLGAWWGTRSLIQTAVVDGLDLPKGSGVDAPGWGSRGAFVCIPRCFECKADWNSWMPDATTTLPSSWSRCVRICPSLSRTSSMSISATI